MPGRKWSRSAAAHLIVAFGKKAELCGRGPSDVVEVQVGEDQVRDLLGPDADGTERVRQPALGDSDLSEIVRQSAELLLGYALRPQVGR